MEGVKERKCQRKIENDDESSLNKINNQNIYLKTY